MNEERVCHVLSLTATRCHFFTLAADVRTVYICNISYASVTYDSDDKRIKYHITCAWARGKKSRNISSWQGQMFMGEQKKKEGCRRMLVTPAFPKNADHCLLKPLASKRILYHFQS